MIFKERKRNEHPGGNPTADAATAAEEQMAFYLRRAFSQDRDVLVLNDLRLPVGPADFAQLDHLVLHGHGLIVIESKSITGSVLINEQGEWCRVRGDRKSGMPSPVLQARRQAEVLRTLLKQKFAKAAAEPKSVLFFDSAAMDVLVAIADQGIIERRIPIAEVFKADIARAFEDTKDHRSGGVSFTAKYKGQPVKGLLTCRLGEQNATAALVYARANATPADWAKLAAAPVANPVAPAQPVKLHEYRFPDGTGSIGLADGWTTDSPSDMAVTVLTGPAGQTVTLGYCLSAVTPDSMTVQMLQQVAARAVA